MKSRRNREPRRPLALIYAYAAFFATAIALLTLALVVYFV